MLSRLKRVLGSTQIMLLIAILLGGVYPKGGIAIKFLLLPLLIIMLTFSLRSMKLSLPQRKDTKPVLVALALSFVLYPLSIYLLSLPIANGDYVNGFMMFAIVPPAVSIIPFTFLLGGDVEQTYRVIFVAYLFSLVYTPLMALLLFPGEVSPLEILKILVVLLVLPLMLSRTLDALYRRKGWKYEGREVVNLCVAIPTYIGLSLAMPVIVAEVWILIPIFLIHIVSRCGFICINLVFSKKKGISKSQQIQSALFYSLQNGSLALAFVLVLLPPASIVPVTIGGLATAPTLMLLTHLYRK